MRQPGARFTIRRMMIILPIIAVGFAALREPFSEVWASVAFALTVIVLLTATIGAILKREASWVGFALFGWASLSLPFGPLRPSDAVPIPTPLTTMLLKAASVRLHRGLTMPPGGSTVEYPVQAAVYAPFDGRLYRVPYAFLQTGNSLFSLIVASGGSVIARVLVTRQDQPVS